MTSGKKVSFKSFISREFYRAAFFPMIFIVITLLGLYFLMNRYLIDRSIDTLTHDRLTHLEEIVKSQRHVLNGQLHALDDMASLLKTDVTRFFAHPERYQALDPAPAFGFMENGAYCKLEDNGGSSLFYSNRAAIGEAEKEKALRSEALDTTFMNVYDSSRSITAVFFNTFDSMSRQYPYNETAYKLGADIDMASTRRYAPVDATHNSGRRSIWSDVIQEPAGREWMISRLVPIYRGEFLEGVAGIDISVTRFIDRLLTLELPWGASTFLLDHDGRALAMSEEVERIFAPEEVMDEVSAPEQAGQGVPTFNILESVSPSLKESLSELMEHENGAIELNINNRGYMLYQETVVDTGWKLMVIADKAAILAPVAGLERKADLAGYGAVGFMSLFCILFFSHLAAHTRNMSGRLAETISGLSSAIRRVGTGVYEMPVINSPVVELDALAESFQTMARDLKTMHENLEQEVLHAEAAKNLATQAEAALKEHQTHLEKVVEQRTIELREANRNLRQDIAMRKQVEQERRLLRTKLQRAEKMEALGTLAGGVAHDLNNILVGIVGYPDLLLRQMTPDDPLRKPIESMQSSGQKAAAIVQDLLTLARRGVPVMELTSLNIIVSRYQASLEYAHLLEHHPGVRVETAFCENLRYCMGSPVHLSKMIMNLVSNAAEAMSEGGEIRISTHNLTVDCNSDGYGGLKEGDYVVVCVRDQGPGIQPEDLEHIFEPFYTKKKMGRSGTGLGMTVVWGTVRDHQGDIEVKSAMGDGTTIEVRLPATRSIPSRQQDSDPDDFYGNGEVVLVVDDVPLQGEIAMAMLTEIGYDAHYVESGEAAVAWLEERPADLVILDMIMEPNIDGLETYRRIIRIHPGQKALIVSGFSETEAVWEAQALGAGAYLKKPYTLDVIARAIREELDRIG